MGELRPAHLEAAYEATVCAAILNAHENGWPILMLMRLGGGAFGNDDAWADDAIREALVQAKAAGLDVRFVSRGPPSPACCECGAVAARTGGLCPACGHVDRERLAGCDG